MVICIAQQAVEATGSILSLIYNIHNLKKEVPSVNIVIACVSATQHIIESAGIPSNIKIDFVTLDDTTLGSMISQWIDVVRFTLNKYGEVQALCEDMILVRDPDTLLSHDKKNIPIKFLKKNYPVPPDHYHHILSKEYFFCNDIVVFERYAELLLDKHKSLTKTMENENGDAKSRLTVSDYLNKINQVSYDLLCEMLADKLENWDDYEVNGNFVATEDLVGGLNNTLSVLSINYDTLELKERYNICPPIKQDKQDKQEEASFGKQSQPTPICGFIFRRFTKNEQVIRTNAFIVSKIANTQPSILQHVSFKNKCGLELTCSISNLSKIGIWSRNTLTCFSNIGEYLSLVGSKHDLIKQSQSGTNYRYYIGGLPIVCEPRIEYLTPDLLNYKTIAIMNLPKSCDVILELEKFDRIIKFIGYVPYDVTQVSEITERQLIDDKLFSRKSANEEIKVLTDTLHKTCLEQSTDYENHIHRILEHDFIRIDKRDCEENDNIGSLIAEAMACGRPLILGTDVELFDLEEGKHFLRDVENDLLVYSDKWESLSRNCRAYYESNIQIGTVHRKIFASLLIN